MHIEITEGQINQRRTEGGYGGQNSLMTVQKAPRVQQETPSHALTYIGNPFGGRGSVLDPVGGAYSAPAKPQPEHGWLPSSQNPTPAFSPLGLTARPFGPC